MWILYVVFPATLVLHDPAATRDSHTLAGVPVMSYQSNYPTQGACEAAGKKDVALVKRAVPGSFYVCSKGSVIR